MSLKKDKQKIIGEVFTEERILSFFDQQPPAGENRDYNLLLRAYRGMTIDSFTKFIEFYVKAGHKLDCQNSAGESFVDCIAKHRHGKPYLNIIKQYT